MTSPTEPTEQPTSPTRARHSPSSPPSSRNEPAQPTTSTSTGTTSSSRRPATTEGSSGTHKAHRFVPFPASKACDVCKLRKVKCAGGQPCDACRLHSTECNYSRATRRQLLEAHNTEPEQPRPRTDETREQEYGSSYPTVPPFLPAPPPMSAQPWIPGPSEWELPGSGYEPVDWSGSSWQAFPPQNNGGSSSANPENQPEGQHPRDNMTVRRMREDAFGNAGLILYEGESASRSMEYWGESLHVPSSDVPVLTLHKTLLSGLTSYIALQDMLSRMLQARIRSSSEDLGRTKFVEVRGVSPTAPKADVWRWGCQRYIFRDRLRDLDLPSPDPMFLPPRLAHRFLNVYAEVIHPLFPVLDLGEISRSIGALFDGSDSTPARRFPSPKAPRIERARDMLVLAFGAQVVGGDGDAECPRDIAVVWSETLRRSAHAIMKDVDGFEGGVDLIRLWIVYAEFSRSYGNSGAELESAYSAARLVTRTGLHKRGTYEFEAAQANDYRTVLAVCFYFEKWACLCHGNPSTLAWGADALAIAAGMNEKSRLSIMINLARLADQVQALFDDLGLLSVDAGMRRALEVYERVLAFHASVDGGFEAIAQLGHGTPRNGPGEDYTQFLVSFTIYGMYLQVKTLCLLPMLQVSVWQALGRDDLQAGMETGLFVDGLADECVKTACETIGMFERHIEVYPHTPELSLSSIFMLYAVSIVYMDVLRLPRTVASMRHADHIRSALKKLEHYQHPAATLAEAMCRDMIVNIIEVEVDEGQGQAA